MNSHPVIITSQQEGPEPYPWLRSWLATPGYWISPGCTGSQDPGCWLLAHKRPHGSVGTARSSESEDWGEVKAWWASGWSTSEFDLAHSDSSCKKRRGEEDKRVFNWNYRHLLCSPDIPLRELGSYYLSFGLLILGLSFSPIYQQLIPPMGTTFSLFCMAHAILLMYSKNPTSWWETFLIIIPVLTLSTWQKKAFLWITLTFATS